MYHFVAKKERKAVLVSEPLSWKQTFDIALDWFHDHVNIPINILLHLIYLFIKLRRYSSVSPNVWRHNQTDLLTNTDGL